jgi:hypothetical protein
MSNRCSDFTILYGLDSYAHTSAFLPAVKLERRKEVPMKEEPTRPQGEDLIPEKVYLARRALMGTP